MFTNPYNHTRGTVCVARSAAGTMIALTVPQQHYKEYNGCFSIL